MSRPADRISLVRDAASGVEAIHARFAGHAYDLHRHDDWLAGVTLKGVQDFFCRGRRQRSTAGRVILIEPGEAHDGQAGCMAGFAYRMLYLPQAWLRAGLGEVGTAGLRFSSTLADDPLLADAITLAGHACAQPCQQLARDAALDGVLSRLRSHLGCRACGDAAKPVPIWALRARECLHDAVARDIGSDDLARAAGAADRFQLARAFRAAYGASPHAYLVQIRLVQARRLLASGGRPAEVAAACGFADQSHLGRWFKRAYRMTPAAYRACCTSVPDRAARSC